MRFTGTLALVLLLGACDAQQAQEAQVPASPQDDAVEVNDDEPVAEAGPRNTIDLQAGGLTVPAQDGEETLAIPFGSMREAAEASLATVLGNVVSRGENEECPAGPIQMTEYPGVTLNFREGIFVGWSASDPYMPPQTRLSLLATDGIEIVEDSTLGEEFVIGNPVGDTISGLFDGAGDEARVTALWAGTNCNFR